MKKLKYTIRTVVTEKDANGNPVEREIFTQAAVSDNEQGRALAEKEAYNGAIEEYDDGKPEPVKTPTQLDVIEAQVTYTAMMTDTLLEV